MAPLRALLCRQWPDSSGTDWTALAQLAEQHGVVAHALRSARAAPDGALPDTFLQDLKERMRQQAQRSLRLLHCLESTLDLFDQAGIPVVTLKGLALSQYLYGELAARAVRDVDLLVSPDRVQEANDLLVANRFVPELDLQSARGRAYTGSFHELGYLAPTGDLVELHWQLVQRRYAIRFDPERMIERAQSQWLQRRAARTLAPVDNLLFLAVHAYKHGWTQLDHAYDYARLLDCAAGELAAARCAAAGLGLERILDTAIGMARELGQRRALPEGSLQQLRAEVTLRERWRDRALVSLRTMVMPTPHDWAVIDLPDFLTPAYYLIRPLRLAARRLRIHIH